ncbi:MAG: FAD-dependent oxidoreductase [Oscillospiraceae bacterium]
MKKVIIIGSGPAGISASLYTIRAGIETIIISKADTALNKAEKIENYYGFSEGISGSQLYKNGIDGALRLGVKLINEEVFAIGYNEKFTVLTDKAEYDADAVIICTGSGRHTPKIKGLNDFDGKGISYCAVCDAFFYRNKDVAVLGSGSYALHEANELVALAKSVTIVTNGEKAKADFPENMKVIEKKILSLGGETTLEKIEFDDGEELNIKGLFIAYKVAGSTALAKKIGAVTTEKAIKVDENMKTSIDGLYAAGDCTGGLLQIAKAVYEGAKAGMEVSKHLR